MKQFYSQFFHMKSGNINANEAKAFLPPSFSFESGVRLELMHRAEIMISEMNLNLLMGLNHLAISVGSKEKVNELTNFFREKEIQNVG